MYILTEKKLDRTDFSGQFGKVILRYKRIDYNLDAIKPIARLCDGTTLSYTFFGWDHNCIVRYLVHRGSTDDFRLLQFFSVVV